MTTGKDMDGALVGAVSTVEAAADALSAVVDADAPQPASSRAARAMDASWRFFMVTFLSLF